MLLTSPKLTEDIFSHLDWNHGLTDDEKAYFEQEGWIGPFPFLSKKGVEATASTYLANSHKFDWKNLANFLLDDPSKEELIWFKSLHAHLPIFSQIVRHPLLVEKIASLIGNDILTWGTSVTCREPGQIHRWHGDIEHFKWFGISAFIGLSNISAASSLKVITRSHKFVFPPQNHGNLSDEQILTLARKTDPACEIKTIPVAEGEFFIFSGRLWHGSNNIGDKTRLAVVAQYSPPSSKVVIPLNFEEPITWHDGKPPCLLVKGTDQARVNNTITM